MLRYEQLSFWEKRSYTEDIDYAIIGAGIVGMTCALSLKKHHPNRKILILERGYLPTGASTKNAGFACFGSPSELLDDLEKSPQEQVWETLQLRYEGLQKLFEHVPKRSMHYRMCGSWDLVPHHHKIDRDTLASLNENIFKCTGLKGTFTEDHKKISRSGLHGFDFAYKNRYEGSIDTAALIEALYQSCIKIGIKFLFGNEVHAIESKEIRTQYGRIFANKIAVCTNAFAQQLFPLEVEPARAQVLVTSPIADLKIKGTFHFDAGYYYFRNVENRLLFGGGRNLDFEAERTSSMETTRLIQAHLKNILRTNILPNQSFDIAYSWAGTLGVGKSKGPIIEKLRENLAVGVRMGGMGVAIGAQVGEKLSQLLK